jgi:regulator of RNase E activity RraB
MAQQQIKKTSSAQQSSKNQVKAPASNQASSQAAKPQSVSQNAAVNAPQNQPRNATSIKPMASKPMVSAKPTTSNSKPALKAVSSPTKSSSVATKAQASNSASSGKSPATSPYQFKPLSPLVSKPSSQSQAPRAKNAEMGIPFVDAFAEMTKNINQIDLKKLSQNFTEEFSRSTADATNQGAEAIYEGLTVSAQNIAKMQEEALEIQKENFDKLSKAADAAFKNMDTIVSLGSSIVDSGSVSIDRAHDTLNTLASDAFKFSNEMFSQAMQDSKNLLSCRTFKDFVELNTKISEESLEGFFAMAQRFSNQMFKLATSSTEPVIEAVNSANNQLSKIFSSALMDNKKK